MAIFTLGTMTDSIKLEARQKDSSLDTVIAAMINDVIADLANRSDISDFLVIGTALTLAANIALPDSLNRVHRVEFTSNGKTWELYERNQLVGPAPIDGKPSSYELVGNVLKLTPEGSAPDTAKIDYYITPTLLASADDTIIVDRAWPEIRRHVLQRMQMFNNKDPQMIAAYGEIANRAAKDVEISDRPAPTNNISVIYPTQANTQQNDS